MSYNRYFTNEQFDIPGEKCVFISHQKKDKEVAKAIADYFLKAGINIYFDEYDTSIDINDPKSVVASIKLGIRRSSHMLCLLSRNAMESKWMPWEIGYGYDKTVLVGLTVKEIAKSTLPEYLQIIPVFRGTKSLNKFLEIVCNKTSWQMLNEGRYVAETTDNHPLDKYLDWHL